MQAEQIQRYIDAIPWVPQEGPQTQAYFHPADVMLYGGAAGGGKTSLCVGLALTRHRESLFVRREQKQLGGVLDHIAELIDQQRKGYSGQTGEWKLPAWDGVNRKVILGSTKNPGDEQKFQGRPKDLLCCDEAANLLGSQVQFLMGWVRSTVPGQRTRTVLASNPPTSADGYWLTEMFAPWLDPGHPKPALPGELRYYLTAGGERWEVPDASRILNDNPQGEDDKWLYPKGYTFIPAKVGDNKFLGSDYLRELQALPEPLRSQMLLGDFTAGGEDGEWQVIPSKWVDDAMNRWEEREFDGKKITSCGVDPSRGGRDSTVIACREGWYYHELSIYAGHEMETGGSVAAKVLELVGDSYCPVHVDVIGIGSSVLDHLTPYLGARVSACNAAGRSEGTSDWSGNLSFVNKRAELWWRFRDMLNPANGKEVALPRNARLKAELCSPTYALQSNGMKIESKQDIVKRLGRSTDLADAVIMAAENTPLVVPPGYEQGGVRVIRQL